MKRLDLKLQKQELAKMLNVSTCTIKNWESNAGTPNCGKLQAIMAFLGYWPYDPKVKTLGQRIKRAREFRGLTLRQLGQLIHIDPTILARWERSERQPKKEFFQRLDLFFTIIYNVYG